MPDRFYAWSHSRLDMYEKCPLQAKLTHLDRLAPEFSNEAMERGNIIHMGMESYLTTPLVDAPRFDLKSNMDGPRALSKFALCAAEVKASDPLVEQQWGYDEKWGMQPWFGKDTWFRLKSDAVVLDDWLATVIDWKTGKPYGSGQDQMEQTAVGVFARYNEVYEVDTRLWYLDSGDEIKAVFSRKEHYMPLREKWTQRANVMLNDTQFVPRPGSHCRRCYFRRSNNGPCAHG